MRGKSAAHKPQSDTKNEEREWNMPKQSLDVDLHKRLKNFTLDLEFCAGRGCLGILGPSGCGKSMTLKSIAGIVRPGSGSIRISPQADRGLAGGEKPPRQARVLYDSAAHIDVRPQKRNVG